MLVWFYSNSLDRTLFYSNMTVPLCIRQGSKRNDDSVNVEELDWSAERQVLIPAEHLWCDFKCRPWAKKITKHQWLVHMGYKHFRHFQNCCNRDGNKNCTYMNYGSIFVATVLEGPFSVLMNKSLVFGDECLAQALHLKSHQRCSAGISQTSQVLPHWLNQSFLFFNLDLYTDSLSW